MSYSLAKVWARKIYAGTKTIDDVAEKYGDAGVAAVKAAYLSLYGVEL